MNGFRRIVLAALCAGVAAGIALTAVQAIKVLPLVAAAENFEDDGHGAHGDGHRHAGGEGARRLVLTALVNALAGCAFALLLVAGLSLAPPADWRLGFAWGVAGFAAFSLAPAAGLPPQLPGSLSAALEARQLWWAGCAAATAGGLALIVFIPTLWARAAGVALILLPHAAGAPRPESDAHGGALPAELAASFVGAGLAANFVFWLTIGGLGAWAFVRLESPPPGR